MRRHMAMMTFAARIGKFATTGAQGRTASSPSRFSRDLEDEGFPPALTKRTCRENGKHVFRSHPVGSWVTPSPSRSCLGSEASEAVGEPGEGNPRMTVCNGERHKEPGLFHVL